MNDPRKALKSAHASLQTAQEHVDACADLHDRGLRFVAGLEAQLAAFDDVALAVAGERAEAMRQAMVGGLAPSMTLSPALLERVGAKADCEHRLEAARQALGSLRSDLEAAQAGEQKCKARIADAHRSVLEAEAEELAEDVANLRSKLTVRQAKLMALENLWAPDGSGQARPLRLSQAAMDTMADPGVTVRMAAFNSGEFRLKETEAVRWRDFASRLLFDASAEYGDLAPAPVVERSGTAHGGAIPPMRDLNPAPGKTAQAVAAAHSMAVAAE